MKNDTYAYDVSSLDGFSFRDRKAHDLFLSLSTSSISFSKQTKRRSHNCIREGERELCQKAHAAHFDVEIVGIPHFIPVTAVEIVRNL